MEGAASAAAVAAATVRCPVPAAGRAKCRASAVGRGGVLARRDRSSRRFRSGQVAVHRAGGRQLRRPDCTHRDASGAGDGTLTRAGRADIAASAANYRSTWAARPAHHRLTGPAAARLACNRAWRREPLQGEGSRYGCDIARCGQHRDVERLRVRERSVKPAVDVVPDLALELCLPGLIGLVSALGEHKHCLPAWSQPWTPLQPMRCCCPEGVRRTAGRGGHAHHKHQRSPGTRPASSGPVIRSPRTGLAHTAGRRSASSRERCARPPARR